MEGGGEWGEGCTEENPAERETETGEQGGESKQRLQRMDIKSGVVVVVVVVAGGVQSKPDVIASADSISSKFFSVTKRDFLSFYA